LVWEEANRIFGIVYKPSLHSPLDYGLQEDNGSELYNHPGFEIPFVPCSILKDSGWWNQVLALPCNLSYNREKDDLFFVFVRLLSLEQ